MTRYILIFITIFFSSIAVAGEIIKGYVFDEKNEPLVGANINWKDTQKGTTTNAEVD